VRGHIEIANLRKQHKVCGERRARNDVLSKRGKLQRQKVIPAEGKRRDQNNDQCRENAPHAPGIKRRGSEAARIHPFEDNLVDEISGDDEKYIDTNEPARQHFGECVKDDNREHREGSQAVNVGSVSANALRSCKLFQPNLFRLKYHCDLRGTTSRCRKSKPALLVVRSTSISFEATCERCDLRSGW
jgi:hypothetical protein